jgi:hypothetical protein
MGVYLKIGGVDVSSFLEENEYSVVSEPIYDDEGAFINIYGDEVRKKIGCRITISAHLTDIDDTTAASLAEKLEGNSVEAEYSAPVLSTATFRPISFVRKLDRVYGGRRFWSADIKMSGFFRQGL